MKKKSNSKKGKLTIDSLKNLSLEKISDQELKQIKGGSTDKTCNEYMTYDLSEVYVSETS